MPGLAPILSQNSRLGPEARFKAARLRPPFSLEGWRERGPADQFFFTNWSMLAGVTSRKGM